MPAATLGDQHSLIRTALDVIGGRETVAVFAEDGERRSLLRRLPDRGSAERLNRYPNEAVAASTRRPLVIFIALYQAGG